MSASNIELTITEENIDIAFDYIDTDQSGYLSVQ
jgi:Ca2+-binding EF-hand superfamily protein